MTKINKKEKCSNQNIREKGNNINLFMMKWHRQSKQFKQAIKVHRISNFLLFAIGRQLSIFVPCKTA